MEARHLGCREGLILPCAMVPFYHSHVQRGQESDSKQTVESSPGGEGSIMLAGSWPRTSCLTPTIGGMGLSKETWQDHGKWLDCRAVLYYGPAQSPQDFAYDIK